MIAAKKRPKQTKGNRRRWWLRLALIGVGLSIGLVLAELALRLIGVGYPLPYAPDEYCGTRLRPGFQAWFTEEGRAFVRINSAGFRDRERSLPKPANTVRIAVLGDSYAEALQVPLERTFWHLLEEELTRRKTFGARRVEVLNFGVSGYGTAQELQVLRHYVLPYAPDVVLLAFFAGNDVRNNSYQLEPYRIRPFFTLSNGNLILNDDFRSHPDYLKANTPAVRFKVTCINRSRILQLVREWRGRAAERPDGVPAGALGIETNAVFLEPADPAWEDAWQVTERLIEQVCKESRDAGARFLLVGVSHPIQVHPDVEQREAYRRKLGVADLFYPERRLEALATCKGFPMIALARPMQDFATKNNEYLHGFANSGWGIGHWNPAGHVFAAEKIADALAER
jgi:lysophospholipase L1-like esterase